MRAADWDNDGAPSKRGRRSWIKWTVGLALAVFGVALVIGGTVGTNAFRNRAKVWPAVQNIHARMQTDEGALDVFRKNPALGEIYANDQAFLDTVRSWRSRVGSLPVQEPPEGPTYLPRADPGEAGATVQGAGGAWLRVEIQGGVLAGVVEGEGITRIFFGADDQALDAAAEHASSEDSLREWEDFHSVMLQCADDGKAAELYRKEPGLRETYPTESAFLAALQALRPGLAALPATTQKGEYVFSIHRYQSPFGSKRVLTLRGADGRELSAAWKDGRLSAVEQRATGRHS